MRVLPQTLLMLAAAIPAVSFSANELRAITEDGRRVVLAPDGKWRFEAKGVQGAAEPDPIYQPALKKFKLNLGTDWIIAPVRDGDGANKRTFQHKTLPIYGMVISDEMPATTSAMKQVIMTNAQTAGASTTILVDKMQQISGADLGYLRFSATIKGLDFVFASNYYADNDGNLQVTCYTGQALFFKYEAECQAFLGGLTMKK